MMAAQTKHVPNASALITEAFSKMADPIQAIVIQLRALIHEAEPNIIEDWKWGPNFYCEGMVCNVWGFKKHASITFFNGVNMKDPYGLFNYGETNSHNRTIKFTTVSEINNRQLIAYIKEAVSLNKLGVKEAVKHIDTPAEMETILRTSGVWAVFNKQNYTYRKEAITGFTSAKQAATRIRRMEKLVVDLKERKK